MLSPIVIFAFNRPDMLERLMDSLQKNTLFDASPLYIYIDGCRNETDSLKVAKVIELAQQVCAAKPEYRQVIISTHNQGLGNAIIAGVTSVIQKHGRAIVLEDDLICTPNFLEFMNQALDFYEPDNRIISVCGYGLKIKRPKDYEGDVYLSGRSSSWGWGTWKNRWEQIDWEIKDWKEISSDRKQQKNFNRNGSDMYGMLKGYMEGRNRSWAIRFCYNQFKLGKYSVCPFLSKIDNKGFGKEATNCKQTYSRFQTNMDTTESNTFNFPKKLLPNNSIAKDCYKYHSITIRIYSKIRKILHI